MKIAGITYQDGQTNLLLKSDSSLLVNKKPFYVPEDVTRVVAYPCVVLRVCKLGKDISPRFARRYYDAITIGLHIVAADRLEEAKQAGQSWVKATAFDGTAPVGTFFPLEDGENVAEWLEGVQMTMGEDTRINMQLQFDTDQAVSEISRYMTIRHGDMLFVGIQGEAFLPKENDSITGMRAEEDIFYCKIK